MCLSESEVQALKVSGAQKLFDIPMHIVIHMNCFVWQSKLFFDGDVQVLDFFAYFIPLSF
jgi:hypothetical protein